MRRFTSAPRPGRENALATSRRRRRSGGRAKRPLVPTLQSTGRRLRRGLPRASVRYDPVVGGACARRTGSSAVDYFILVERVLKVVLSDSAQRGSAGNDGNRDQGRNQAVLDGRRPTLIPYEFPKEVFQGRNSCLGVRNFSRQQHLNLKRVTCSRCTSGLLRSRGRRALAPAARFRVATTTSSCRKGVERRVQRGAERGGAGNDGNGDE